MYRRPLSVSIVAAIIVLLGLLSLLATIMHLIRGVDPKADAVLEASPFSRSVTLTRNGIEGLVDFVSGIFLFRRANWARLLWSGWSVFVIVATLTVLPNQPVFVPSLLFTFALILILYLPAANRYFTPNIGDG